MNDLVEAVLAIEPPKNGEPPSMAWVAKYAVTFYHGCDRHPGDWLMCDRGPCPLFRAALAAEVVPA